MQLRCLDEDRKPLKHASASGFVRIEDGVAFLYTCWHVVTGYDRNHLRVRNELPKRAFLEVFVQNHQRQPDGGPGVDGLLPLTVALYDESERPKKPLWYQDRAHLPHPDLNAIGLRVPSWHDAVKIPLSAEVKLSELHLVSNPVLPSNTMLTPGDRIYIVGFPYGPSGDRSGLRTPVVLTRFVRATAVRDRPQEVLLDSGGVPGMSGGPVFVERDDDIALLGVYTGIIYPDPVIERSRKATALGACASLSSCWRGSLPLVREPTEASSYGP
ncbi:MAG: trypsin-like peptidase domain-containing protein [Rhodanobacteraceae bacterium]